jgi:SAM-dependent methyltransferase
MSSARMYRDLAHLWPLISPAEEYVEEAEVLRAAFEDRLGPGRHSLLDLGIGGGHHISPLIGDFDVTGVDLSPEMLAHSRRLNPDVEHHVGDMRTIRLDREFDAVLIHDSISHMLTENDLRAALATAAVHLRTGGVLVACPDWFRETFPNDSVSHSTNRRGDTSLTYIEYLHDPDPADTTIEMLIFYLIREGGRVRVERDRQTMGLFPRQTWLELIEQAGFDVETRSFGNADGGKASTLLIGVYRG